jgi:hypothetical protein
MKIVSMAQIMESESKQLRNIKPRTYYYSELQYKRLVLVVLSMRAVLNWLGPSERRTVFWIFIGGWGEPCIVKVL